MDVVDLIIAETKEVNEKGGKEFDIAQSVVSQMPFFACMNVFMDNKIQRDIQRYLYCEKFNVSPYEGDYNKQPAEWIRKVFLIRNALAKKEKKEINNVKQHNSKIST